ncbi:MAG: hypothetical protein HN802_07040 [Candidatus Jacksonbacteria bacterium]|jgi:Spy/CpxP family protein refolding chaperone|nr:hypothetical protein [Candidatus Jacksonbacteria bacterium]
MRVLRSPEQKEKDKTKARNFIAKMNADPNFDVNTKHGPELKIRRSNETAPSIPEEKQTQAWVNEADRKYKKALHRKELSKTYAMPPSDKKSDDLQK